MKVKFASRLCQGCQGACCKALLLNPKGTGKLDEEFLKTRGLKTDTDGRIIIPHKCQHLTEDGLCDIYEQRPAACRLYKPGCKECLLARKLQREKQ